jgi:hypothetical protein
VFRQQKGNQKTLNCMKCWYVNAVLKNLELLFQTIYYLPLCNYNVCSPVTTHQYVLSFLYVHFRLISNDSSVCISVRQHH